MKFELMLLVDGKWVHDSFHDDPSFALAALCMRTGKVLMGNYEDDYDSMRIVDGENNTVGCVREHKVNDVPVNKPGTPPNGDQPGPLRRWHGLTWVGWVNFLFLRWFLFRIHYVVEKDGTISRYGIRFVPSWRW